MGPERALSASAEKTARPEPILRIENLCVDYRSRGSGSPVKRAVSSLNLSVNQGEVFGFRLATDLSAWFQAWLGNRADSANLMAVAMAQSALHA
jgi:hypothetical protein